VEIENVIKEGVLKQEAYDIEDRTCRIKLDANENPYALPIGLKEKLLHKISSISLNRYPSAGSPEMRSAIAGNFGVTDDMVLIGNGADELIQILLTAVKSEATSGILIPVPTFAMYKISAVNAGHNVIEIPLDDGFDLPLEKMLNVISEKNPGITFLSYPNNPSGNCFDAEKITRILEVSRGIVVVDEAYFHFSKKTFLPSIKKWDNLIILRTLSKVGLSALRIGIMVSNPTLIHQLNKVRLPYNLNTVSQVAGKFFIEHEKEFLLRIDQIISSREWLIDQLRTIDGIKPYPSDANFILFSCCKDKNSVYEKLISKGILVKNLPSYGPLRDCMRVTVGTEEENREFVKSLKESIIP
jgi:histidinol-phosphate aminotransferase